MCIKCKRQYRKIFQVVVPRYFRSALIREWIPVRFYRFTYPTAYRMYQMHSIYEIPVWSVVVFTLQFRTYTLHTPVVHHKRPIHTYINYIMIFVLSFTAVVFLVQKFDFRKCMLKSNTKNGNDFLNCKDHNDEDDDSYDGSNDTFQTIWTTDIEWIDDWTDLHVFGSETPFLKQAIQVCICTANNYIRQKFAAIRAIIFQLLKKRKIFPRNRDEEGQFFWNLGDCQPYFVPIFDVLIL